MNVPLQLTVLPSQFEFIFYESWRAGNILKVNYSVKDLVGQNQEGLLFYDLQDRSGVSLVKGQESIIISANSQSRDILEIELPKNAIGEFRLFLNLETDEDSFRIVRTVFLGTRGLTGLAISDENQRTLTIFGIIFVLLGLLYFVFRFLRKHHKRTNKTVRKGRHLIKLKE